jgi:hypothetical protein
MEYLLRQTISPASVTWFVVESPNSEGRSYKFISLLLYTRHIHTCPTEFKQLSTLISSEYVRHLVITFCFMVNEFLTKFFFFFPHQHHLQDICDTTNAPFLKYFHAELCNRLPLTKIVNGWKEERWWTATRPKNNVSSNRRNIKLLRLHMWELRRFATLNYHSNEHWHVRSIECYDSLPISHKFFKNLGRIFVLKTSYSLSGPNSKNT